ncbi:MAG TPA: methyltransferase domain-containing protein [Gaiellaceae bacterium]|jgi:SAM-dependent methyltransferase|nr:methyltransferase domain-containing protein [Gaiellaceae bacterium]
MTTTAPATTRARAERLARARALELERGGGARFERISHRVAFALDRWELETASVLDVGCGFGNGLLHFGPGSLGLDNSSAAIDFCRALGLEAVQLDVERDDLASVPDGAFAYLWISDIVEHLDAPRVVLRRLAPKLRPGGRALVFVSVLPESVLARRLLRRLQLRPYDAHAHYLQYTVSTARHLLARAGLRTTRVAVPTPPRLERVSGLLPARAAPRLLFEAVPDPELERLADESERRNASPG